MDRFAADGYDLLLAGHTHGGQLRVPGYGALVTNCGIDRGRVSGLSMHPQVSPENGKTPGCTSPPASAPHRGRRSGSPAAPRRHCSRSRPDRREMREPPKLSAKLTEVPSGASCSGVWRSLVARFVRDEEVAGSNPVTPTLRGGVVMVAGFQPAPDGPAAISPGGTTPRNPPMRLRRVGTAPAPRGGVRSRAFSPLPTAPQPFLPGGRPPGTPRCGYAAWGRYLRRVGACGRGLSARSRRRRSYLPGERPLELPGAASPRKRAGLGFSRLHKKVHQSHTNR